MTLDGNYNGHIERLAANVRSLSCIHYFLLYLATPTQ